MNLLLEPCKVPQMTPGMWYLAGVPLWCFNGVPFMRPEILVSRKNTYIGKITNPYRTFGRTDTTCCPWMELDIKDPNEMIRYKISATCCQAGENIRYNAHH